MSNTNVETFVRFLQQSEDLRDRFQDLFRKDNDIFEALSDYGRAVGYEISSKDLRDWMAMNASKFKSSELSDADLETVAGGTGAPPSGSWSGDFFELFMNPNFWLSRL